MTTEESWSRTPREIKALSQVYEHSQQRWALQMSDFRNAWLRGKDMPAWLPSDFIGGGVDYNTRAAEFKKELMEVQHANLQLKMMKVRRHGQPAPDGLPSWAVKRW